MLDALHTHTEKFIISQIRRPEVWNQDISRIILPLKHVADSLPCLSLLLVFARNPGHSMAYGCIILFPTSGITWPHSSCVCLFLWGHQSYWITAYPKDFILTWLHQQRSHFQIRACSKLLKVKISTYFVLGGGGGYNSICNISQQPKARKKRHRSIQKLYYQVHVFPLRIAPQALSSLFYSCLFS